MRTTATAQGVLLALGAVSGLVGVVALGDGEGWLRAAPFFVAGAVFLAGVFIIGGMRAAVSEGIVEALLRADEEE